MSARFKIPNYMKKIFFALTFLCYQVMFAQNEKTISSAEIHDVKIYLAGAEISRAFKTSVDAGVTQLIVPGLSSQIDRNSISAVLSGDAMVLNSTYSLDYLQEKKTNPFLKKLQDSLEVLNNAVVDLNMMKSVYNDEAGMLNANKQVGGSNVGLNAENLHKVIDFYRARMIELKQKIVDIDRKTDKLNEKIQKINEQINVENGKLNQPSGTIFITVSAQQKSNVSIELSYYEIGASWHPSYDLRAKDVNSPVNLLYKANVSQSTGENWENVHVSLSTGNPAIGGTKPELTPWFLRFIIPRYRSQPAGVYQKEAVPNINMAGSRRDENTAYYLDGLKLTDSVRMQQSQVVTEFIIQIPYTVHSDGKEVQMDIQSYSLPATYAYYAVPKIDRDAFLVASITGWEQLNLLPGQANVYLENSYVGQSDINPSETSDTLQLSFGRDKRINIKRERVKDMNTTKFFGGNIEKEFMYETTVRNTKKESITITLQDQLPLSTDESIKITNGETSGGNLIAETGMISWKFDIKTGETKKIRLGYKVKYPRDRTIPGL
jgi:uncharacterized protein (TIGR02231 family)